MRLPPLQRDQLSSLHAKACSLALVGHEVEDAGSVADGISQVPAVRMRVGLRAERRRRPRALALSPDKLSDFERGNCIESWQLFSNRLQLFSG
jgi:hypothetical protein